MSNLDTLIEALAGDCLAASGSLGHNCDRHLEVLESLCDYAAALILFQEAEK